VLVVGMFPTGSVVELSDGSIGVVLEQNRVNALRPTASSTGAMCIAKGHEHGAFGIDHVNCFN